MLEIQKVKYNPNGNKICWLCGNHYDGDSESCPDCENFFDKYVFVPGKAHVFRVYGKVFRVYYENSRDEVLNLLKNQ